MNKRTIILICLFLLLVVELAALGFAYSIEPSAKIILTNRGYRPGLVVLQKGGIVTFQADTAKYFWPASNPHPLHNGYSGFDAGRAISPGASWTFQFDQVGFWGYHDHLAPQFGGLVVVVDKKEGLRQVVRQATLLLQERFFSGPVGSDVYYKQCGGLNKPCWDSVFTNLVVRRGSRYALELVEDLRTRHADFANYCHQYADFIGELSYWEIPRQNRWKEFVPLLAGQCSSGYLHGYMGEYVSHGSVREGIAFCDRMASAYPDYADVSYECYRGVGNGLAFRYGLENWNDARTIIDSALGGCDGLKESDVCRRGVFSGIDHMNFGIHGFALKVDKDDPFGICTERSGEIEAMCYEQLVSSFFAAIDYDLDKATSYLTDLSDKYGRIVVDRLVRIPYELSSFGPDGYMHIVSWCRRIPSTLHNACLGGFIDKLITVDVDHNQDSSLAADFCKLSVLTNQERLFCKTVVEQSGRFQSK